jgi:hypothetical protein
VKKAVEGVSRYRVTLFALVVQFLAVVTQPIVVRTRTALVLGNVLTRTTCAVVMMHAICGWLLVLIDGIERCCLGHWECSFLSSRDDISILRAALLGEEGWERKMKAEEYKEPERHEARLRELLARQGELNAALDLDKGERQIAPPAAGEEGVADIESEGPAEPGPGAEDSRPNGEARRRREYDRRVPDSRVADTDREKESPAQKGFSPMTGRKV